MLPERIRLGRVLHTVRTAVDAKLMERSGIDEFSLRRVRKEFLARTQKMTYLEKRTLTESGTCPRFTLMIAILKETWAESTWETWLRYLEHSPRDIDEMCRGEYPISPYLMRVFSALFGIKVDFLLLGSSPAVDRIGACIDVWPMQDAR